MTSAPEPQNTATQRIDLWLWHARFFKTRSLATKMCRAGKVRLNGQVIRKASVTVGPEDVLTFPQGDHVRIARILALAERRGPAAEAQSLYEDLSPPRIKKERPAPVAVRDAGSGRPTKAERRALDRLRDQ
ncbi:RNA-binding S4 domain-containing protein [Emcibacter nanhaiensis]|uniref:RNA-binding S4 domain-containing protein n=1 Tax=Emcibacter nanhaiensis TaxID=1505037 RepID=A0A501PPH5_9PROT|nr:RNA-binding S4 domain-containing protein [Emcibacter nanhaiensis]TPD61696.1 RNA-binding S4 domain-containing protein [Emcibacter nanhaiensis]